MTSPFPRALLLPLVLLSLSASRPAQAQADTLAPQDTPSTPPTAAAAAAPPTVPPAPPSPPKEATNPRFTFSGNKVWSTTKSEPGWLDSKIDLSVHDSTVMDAIKKVAEQAKITLDHIEVKVSLPDNRFSLDIKDVPARDALAAVARLGGAVPYVSTNTTVENDKKTEKTIIYLEKRTSNPPGPVLFTGDAYNPATSIEVQRQISDAMKAAREATARANSYSSRNGNVIYGVSHKNLPDIRVSLDKKDMDIRDALKDVLKQADLGYSLDADIPEGLKKPFTLVNVPIATALDVICESAGIGWRTDGSAVFTLFGASGQNSKSPKSAERPKPTVLISKKYAEK